MGMTMAEKIIACAAGVDLAKAGDIHTVELDRLMSNDGTTHLTIDMYNKLKHPHIKDKKKLVWIVDHNIPSDSPKTAASHKKMRDFARENGITYYEGEGVCHQVMMENHVRPGELIFGADSHTCAYGALGAFGTGVGCTDYLYAMVTGTSWLLVPETLRFNLTGKLPENCSGKDVILTIIGMIGVDGALYKAMEFTGSAIRTMSMDQRLSISNMAIEAGGKAGLIEVDDITRAYMDGRTERPYTEYHSDPDAVYAHVYEIDAADIPATVAWPHLPSNTRPAAESRDVKIDQAVIGSCTNGRLEDMRQAADVLRGRKVHPDVRCIVIPATQGVWLQCVHEGLMDVFINAHCVVSTPTCGPCLGGYMGILAAGERCVSSTNRNFVGRMGDPTSEVYLASPAVCAASAVAGHIALPSDLD